MCIGLWSVESALRICMLWLKVVLVSLALAAERFFWALSNEHVT
jgi:hypothetical protein